MTRDEIVSLLKPIRIAKVLSIEKHPNADRLVIVQALLRVSENKDDREIRQVVTGASNLKINDYIPFLDQGNLVPGYKIMNGEDVMLSTRNLRGIESTCMILSDDEIGLNDKHEGIWIIEESRMKGKELGISILEVLTDEELDIIVNNQKQDGSNNP